jgi:hypothetical protein
MKFDDPSSMPLPAQSVRSLAAKNQQNENRRNDVGGSSTNRPNSDRVFTNVRSRGLFTSMMSCSYSFWRCSMHRIALPLVLALLTVSAGHSGEPAADWAINATAIEACSCPHFCICYFNSHPAAHHENGKTEHFCKFNNAYKVSHGHYGNVDLAGSKFWINGDLGGDFSKGQMDWALVTFDKGTTAEQRQALGEIVGKVFPVKWKSLQVAEGDIDTWAFDKDHAHATLNGGRTAEIKLARFQGMTDEPAVLKNVKYWGTPRNDGFVMMPNEIETYKEGPKAYEFKGTNGFMLTFDMTSKDVPVAKGDSMSY